MKQMRRTQDERALIESRLAARLAAALTQRSAALPPDIGERLRFAREQALARARDGRRQHGVVAVSRHGGAVLGGWQAWWPRLASMLPLAMLVVGLMLIERQMEHEQVLAAADIDALLLADTLPPSAYSDPGFAEFLRSSAAQ